MPYSFLIGSLILAQKVKLIYVHVTLSCCSRVRPVNFFNFVIRNQNAIAALSKHFSASDFVHPLFSEFPHRLQTIINNISFSFFFANFPFVTFVDTRRNWQINEMKEKIIEQVGQLSNVNWTVATLGGDNIC